MKKLLRLASVIAVGFSLSTGIAAAQTTIDTTGPDSTVTVTRTVDVSNEVTNDNTVDATNNNQQDATTGAAVASDSTNAGDAVSGDARNNSNFKADVTIDNSSATNCACTTGAGAGNGGNVTVRDTGPDSTVTVDNSFTSENTVMNTNKLTVTNNNAQTATSGDATVNHNTNGGSARSGDAVNTSTSSFTFNVTN